MKYRSTITAGIFIIMFGLISTGCSYNIPNYDASVDNVKKMRRIPTKINVGEFTSRYKGLKSIFCRGQGSVGTPDNTTFEEYIKNALISELKFANKYEESSKIIINVHLDEMDFNSTVGIAKWEFRLKATSSNSKIIVVKSIYEFSSSFVADSACSDVANAFVPAVQKLIKDIVRHRDFIKLL